MGKKNYWNSEVKNTRWIKEGRGLGAGKDYKPWLTVRDVPSDGRSHRIFGHLTQRTHHLLSDIELASFLLLQWRQTTTDIREQFPLDLALTKVISTECGIQHPAQNGILQYMSSDFLVSTNESALSSFAIQAKSQTDLLKPRTIEKLEIERRFWKEKGIPWFLITEQAIPKVAFTNIEWLYNLQHRAVNHEEEMVYFEFFNKQVSDHSNLTIIELSKHLDSAYDLELGESLFQLRLLLARRYFHFNILIPFTRLRCSDLFSESYNTVDEVFNVSD
ncbi:MAG: heteromeric transposase endonuclease subunit TnsA [Gammaproteobacteria bacterium]|nr:heteromeric transposase endonuclease subunit TnsA [Gammaproteobacteria bacterium]MBL4882785.1 heteromeric transposase endonuclease subunit TnsA [Oleispira sp.]